MGLVRTALNTLGLMIPDEPIVAASKLIQKVAKAIESETMAQRHAVDGLNPSPWESNGAVVSNQESRDHNIRTVDRSNVQYPAVRQFIFAAEEHTTLTGNSLPPTYPTGAHIFAPSAMGPGISGGDPAGFPVDLNFDVLTTDLLDFFQTGYVQYGA